jgi:hypothetical protein
VFTLSFILSFDAWRWIWTFFIYRQWCLDTLFGWISYGFLLPTLGTRDHRIYTYLYVQLRCRDMYSRDAGFPFKKGAPIMEHALCCIRQAVWFCRLPKRCRYNLYSRLCRLFFSSMNILSTQHTHIEALSLTSSK